MSTPATSIYMCTGVPLNNRYDHTLYFASESAQRAYFTGKCKTGDIFTNYTYVRRNWKLKVAATIDRARVWSYLFFRNGATGKYYYYFINQVEYISDTTVELSLELDVLQTYMFDWTLKPCYVEREHSATDFPGDNLIDEGLEVGDYVTPLKETIDLSDYVILTAATMDIFQFYRLDFTDASEKQIEEMMSPYKFYADIFDNIYSGFMIFSTPIPEYGSSFASLLEKLNKHGRLDAIFTMWQYPKRLVDSAPGEGLNFSFAEVVKGSKELTYIAQNAPTSLDGYTPKNKKLLQYPYCFIYATNNNGGSAVYKYHDFFAGNAKFSVKGNISPDAVVKLTPVGYKSGDPTTYDYSESLAMTGYPLCAWNSDSYKMWLAQNQNQQNLGYAMSGLKIVGGVAAIVGGVAATGGTGGAGAGVGLASAGAGVSMITSGASEIASNLAQRADKEIVPPQARGTYSGSHNVANNTQNFDLHHKTIHASQARIIDNYFTMYGYACRRVKIPNINARPYFNYVKTIGSNVTGEFCMDDIKLINDIFDKGVTFWKTTDVGNYDLNNSPS